MTVPYPMVVHVSELPEWAQARIRHSNDSFVLLPGGAACTAGFCPACEGTKVGLQVLGKDIPDYLPWLNGIENEAAAQTEEQRIAEERCKQVLEKRIAEIAMAQDLLCKLRSGQVSAKEFVDQTNQPIMF